MARTKQTARLTDPVHGKDFRAAMDRRSEIDKEREREEKEKQEKWEAKRRERQEQSIRGALAAHELLHYEDMSQKLTLAAYTLHIRRGSKVLLRLANGGGRLEVNIESVDDKEFRGIVALEGPREKDRKVIAARRCVHMVV